MRFIFIFCLLMLAVSCVKKEKFSFTLQEDDGFLLSGPVSLDVTFLGDQDPQDFILVQNGDSSVPFQLQNGKIWFVHNAEKGTAYHLEKNVGNEGKADPNLKAIKKSGDLQLVSGSNTLVGYRYEMTYPPVGVDFLYKKSGYIHPIISPKGDTLTRIQPPDHYHHYGLWGPWTHTRVDNTLVDFWNLGQGMGTVLFKEFKETSSGGVFASFTAAQEHIDLKTPQAPQVALNEDLEVTLWDLGRDDRYILDYETRFNSPLENGILFEAYRYGGGLGLRFTERWKADNCSVLTSEGKDRATADGSNARWALVSGASSDGTGTNGILFMSHPENRMHPEPMRVWPMDANGGRGDLFFQFCPIRYEEWKLEPNTTYSLNYRLVVFDGELTAEEAEAYWQLYANRPEVEIISN